MSLTPDVANGLKIYAECAACHQAEGFGSTTGSTPQIAGQHRSVIIKQLADYRTGARESVLMAPYAATEVIGGEQAVADVAQYISTLPVSVDNGKGLGVGLPVGEQLYAEQCAACHGANGEGSDEKRVPRLQAQHYKYLVRQFDWIRSGQRGNADAAMVAKVHDLPDNEVQGALDYISRLMPPEELRAPEGWKNPDFK
jgi:cytochrome c553